MSFRMNNKMKFCGLQLHFDSGISSPKLETEVKSKKKWQHAEIDPFDKIAFIEAHVSKTFQQSSISALRFRDADGIILQCISYEN